MSRAVFRLAHDEARSRAVNSVRNAPQGWIVTLREPTRTLEQNALMWSLMTSVSEQVQWPVDGEMRFLPPEDWKDIFTAALKRESRIAKGIDGGSVMLGTRTSKMTKKQFSDLCELILAFGSERGVVFHDDRAVA